jgi:hypothetical protein
MLVENDCHVNENEYGKPEFVFLRTIRARFFCKVQIKALRLNDLIEGFQ